MHTNETPYTCTVCSKTFTTNGALTVHMRTHNKEAPYSCSMCDKAFTTNSQLTVHMRTHTKETPYKCVDCDQAFTTSHSLKRHLKSRHTTKESPEQNDSTAESSSTTVGSNVLVQFETFEVYIIE